MRGPLLPEHHETIVCCEHAPQSKDFTQKKACRYRKLSEAEQSANRYKSKTSARVEHVFGAMKRQFGFTKVRYRGLDKNAHCVFTKCALVNLVLAKKHYWRISRKVVPEQHELSSLRLTQAGSAMVFRHHLSIDSK